MGRLSKRTIQCRLARKQRDLAAAQALGVQVEPLVRHQHHHERHQQQQQQEQQRPQQQAAQQQQQLAAEQQPQQQPTGSSSSRSSSRSSLTSLKVLPFATGPDFSKLGPESLRRYQQAFGLELDACSSSEEAAWAVAHHFAAQGVPDEKQLLRRFAAAAQRGAAGGTWR